ncbi:MAG TPA: TlpA disulfide reductase family protein [Candidatus Saccharimonadales bacterium]|nr:TlpA disulfide reductase family protein [Candidatus Saccharimonadales bacterium]
MTERPEFQHKPPKRGVIGPFSGRQLLFAALAVLITTVLLIAITTPLGSTGLGPGPVNPRATPFLIGSPPPEGLQAGSTAPELTIDLDDGSTYQLTDLQGRPIRLADLRGKVVWLNFFATWCPPCQQETPILRDLDARYRDKGLAIVGVSVQETSPDDIASYAGRYQLGYTIGFDGSGHVLREYKVFALPTQFFIDPNGVIVQTVNGPVDEAGAVALIEGLLEDVAAGSPAPSVSAAPSGSPTP